MKADKTKGDDLYPKDGVNRKKPRSLFDVGEDWEEDWQGMPEYIAEDYSSWKKITVHFRDEKSLAAFSNIIGQPITVRTKGIWFPKEKEYHYTDRRYVDEESKE